jgi:predicted nucleic-acid-binding Zn-ribbon protein
MVEQKKCPKCDGKMIKAEELGALRYRTKLQAFILVDAFHCEKCGYLELYKK